MDTFKELFEVNEPLFHGLAVHDRWDWRKTYPVVKIDFAGGFIRSSEDLETIEAGEALLSTFEIESMKAVTGTVIPEDTSNNGQADMTVRLENKTYEMEIKVITGELPEGSPNTAPEQVRRRNYAE